jgi:hypothetical protein
MKQFYKKTSIIKNVSQAGKHHKRNSMETYENAQKHTDLHGNMENCTGTCEIARERAKLHENVRSCTKTPLAKLYRNFTNEIEQKSHQEN